jgi:hypothetical protein
MGERAVAVRAALRRLIPLGPARAREVPADRARIVLKLGEEAGPALIDRGGVLQPALIEIGDETGVGAEKKGSPFQVHCSLFC